MTIEGDEAVVRMDTRGHAEAAMKAGGHVINEHAAKVKWLDLPAPAAPSTQVHTRY